MLFINPRSGDGKAARAGLAQRAREKGIEAVILAPGQNLAALAREAVTGGADALGMARGDGPHHPEPGVLKWRTPSGCTYTTTPTIYPV